MASQGMPVIDEHGQVQEKQRPAYDADVAQHQAKAEAKPEQVNVLGPAGESQSGDSAAGNEAEVQPDSQEQVAVASEDADPKASDQSGL